MKTIRSVIDYHQLTRDMIDSAQDLLREVVGSGKPGDLITLLMAVRGSLEVSRRQQAELEDIMVILQANNLLAPERW